MDTDLTIVRKVVSKGREFYVEGKYGVSDSLKNCNDAGCKPLFMPELAMARADADKDSRLWQTWFLAPSVRVTGRSKANNPVVVYAHVPTSLSDPVNIRKFVDESALVNGAGPMPQDEFYALLEREGDGRVFVVGYDKLRESTSGVVKVDNALDHPQIVPFLGGEQIAKAYLAKHKDVYGKSIGVWHSDDLKDRPMGRVVGVGDDDGNGLVGGSDLNGNGRVAGVAPEAQVGVAKTDGTPLESRLQVLDDGAIVKVDGRLYVRAPERLALSDR